MNILIVESAAKAKTLERYLGSSWRVMATGGHVQTLPHDRKEHGKQAGKAYWANQPGELPAPPWVWTDRGETTLNRILEKASDDTTFWIATDPDREGEFIAWRLEELLADKGKTPRITFQEVTESAIKAAIQQPRELDVAMVQSAMLRMFLDRLVGYRTSKLARSVVPGVKASMGRVQTPTLGFVVDRELAREAHVPIPFFEVRAQAGTVDLQVRFHEPGDAQAWKDESGRVKLTRTFDAKLANEAEQALRSARMISLEKIKRGSRKSPPKAPLSTDALLQAAGSRFGWSPKKTSALASMLYQAGHITYIRTDSTRLAESAIEAARALIAEQYGNDHLAEQRSAKAATPKAEGVQDAHEAIRPTRFEDADVELEDNDARKLYRLIRAHTLASQMAPSRYESASLTASVESFDKPVVGTTSWRVFAGWELAYEEFRPTPATTPPPLALETGVDWPLDPETEEFENPQLIEDQTRPPSRFRPHTLIKKMKDSGIGRPSTYASTVEKLEERNYVVTEDGALAPTDRGRTAWLEVAPLYGERTENDEDNGLFSTEYTSLMEQRLDSVARDELTAPELWEQWRDEIRALHELARDRKNQGEATPRTIERLERLMENAPEDFVSQHPAVTGGVLSETAARAQIEELHEAGVQPAPSPRQHDYIQTLVEQLDMPEQEAAALIGLEKLDQIHSSAQASAIIEELSVLRDERRPPSRKQVALIDRLRDELKLSKREVAALIEMEDLGEITGGREGSASALIDQLLALSKKAKSKSQEQE